MSIEVNHALCTGCGVCVESCPEKAIFLRDYRAVIDDEICTECMICVKACPNGAITALPEATSPLREHPLPAAEPLKAPTPIMIKRPSVRLPIRSLTPLVGAALSMLGREVLPYLADSLAAALQRRLTPQKEVYRFTETDKPQSRLSRSETYRRGNRRKMRYRARRSGRT